MKKLILVTIILTIPFFRLYAWEADSPSMVGVYSLIVPGSGQVVNGDYVAGAGHFLTSVFFQSLISEEVNKDDFLTEEDLTDEDERGVYVNKTTLKASVYSYLWLNTHFYSSYAAYRDARQSSDLSYSTPIPTENLNDLVIAPFNPEYLMRPGTLIPLALLAIYLNNSEHVYPYQRLDGLSKNDLYLGQLFGSTGACAVGEEAFFRGYLNNEFSDEFGEGWGLASSSAIFGLSHSGSGNQASTLEAGLLGAYMGWIQQTNEYKISQSVAIHFWINAISAYYAIERGEEAELANVHFQF